MKNPKAYTYDIYLPSERSAGITGFTDIVHVLIESGDPGGNETGPDSFREFMLGALREWYDGASVIATKEADHDAP